MNASTLRIAVADGAFDAHLALPARPNGNGLVLLQEIFGVTDKIRRYCDLFASHGYAVAAPDVFWRMEPNVQLPYTREGTLKAFEYLKRLDEAHALADIEATRDALRERTTVERVAVIGFCLGGKLASRLAARDAFASAVAFYGVGIEKFADALKGSTTPLQFHFAERDRFVPPEARAAIADAVRDRPHTEIHVYDTDHAFFRAELDDEASRRSFERSLAFLEATAGDAHAR